jgi:two-component sensor histidine kinase
VTIRYRLGLAVAVALSPVLVLGVVQAVLGYSHEAGARRLSLVDAAARTAAATRTKMQAAAAVLHTLAPETAGPGCNARLKTVLDHVQGYENLIRFDASGRVLCAATASFGGAQPATPAWFARMKSGEPLVMLAAPAGMGAAAPAVLAATPLIEPDGRFGGALAAVISADSLRADVSDPVLPQDAKAALLDASGRVIAPSPPAFADQPLPGWAREANSPLGYRHVVGRATNAHVDVIAPVGHDLYVMLSAPAPRFLSWARLHAIYNIVLPLLGWFGAWVAVWIATDRVVIRWLSYLDRIASIYAKGRFSVRPVKAEAAPQEIRALAQTLDAMADAIVARDLSLRESLDQKDTLMREIHHRVKNNLQIITSLLNMQQRALTDPTAKEAMSDTRQRITALALIYRALYQSPDLRRVDVRQFLEELVGNLSAGDGARPMVIRTELAADDLEIDPDKLAPLALFAVEAIANARKHAFKPGEGLIRVGFHVFADRVLLEICDDGVHQPGQEAQEGVGRTLMSAFARQLRGRMEREINADGVVVRLTFPPPEPAKPLTPQPFLLSEGGNPAQA